MVSSINHDNGGFPMLILRRKSQESVVVAASNGFERLLKVTVLGVNSGVVRLGFEVDEDVSVHRSEVWSESAPATPRRVNGGMRVGLRVYAEDMAGDITGDQRGE
jgi:carbon storage regulator CsrA